jgi:hypothetical protein
MGSKNNPSEEDATQHPNFQQAIDSTPKVSEPNMALSKYTLKPKWSHFGRVLSSLSSEAQFC